MASSTTDKLLVQFLAIAQKYNVSDVNSLANIISKLYAAKGVQVSPENLKQKYAPLLEKVITILKQKQLGIPDLSKLVFRSQQANFTSKLNELIQKVKQNHPEFNETTWERIEEELNWYKYDLLDMMKNDNWEENLPFIKKVIEVLWDNPDAYSDMILKIPSIDDPEIKQIIMTYEVIKEKDEDQETRTAKGLTALTSHIKDMKFRKKLSQLLKDFLEKWETSGNPMNPDAMASDFYYEYKENFLEPKSQEDLKYLLIGLAKRFDVLIKERTFRELYFERYDEVVQAIERILTDIVKDKQKTLMYSKMKGLELLSRLFDLLTKDSAVGNIVTSVPDLAKKEIVNIIRKKFTNAKAFKGVL